MLIKSRGASCTFKLFIAIVGTMALVNSIGLFKLTFHGNFFLYFTNISNLATVLYYWCNIVQIHKNRELGQKPWLPEAQAHPYAWYYGDRTCGVFLARSRRRF